MAKPTSKRKYRVLVGLDYPPDKRAEEGDVVDDLPAESVDWLRKQRMIEPVSERKRKGD